MGNAAAKREYEEFDKKYVKHGDANDPRYGHVAYYHSRNNPSDIVLVKDKWTNSLAESNDIKTFVNNRQGINHENLAVCRNYIQEEDKQWCSTFHKHNLAFDYHDNNLQKEIERRNADEDFYNVKRFSEPEIWSIANSMTNVDLTLAREGGSYHGDIQPATVLLDEAGKPKTIDSGLLHLNKTTYERMLHDRSVKAALSPNLLEQIKMKKVNPEYDPSKEDSWGLGMTALCSATNTTLDDYYDWSVPELRRHVLNENLDKINGPYSKQFHGFVESCLEETEDRRRSLEDHETFLRPYQNDIKNMKLDFKTRQVTVNQAADRQVITETKVVVVEQLKRPELTGIVDPNDFFGQMDQRIIREVNPAPIIQPQTYINYDFNDDFFDKPVVIREPYY